MNVYPFKVKQCPICGQGWVEIVKGIKTGRLFLYCNECESEWDHPDKVTRDNSKNESNEMVTEPSKEDIEAKGWSKYILRQ